MIIADKPVPTVCWLAEPKLHGIITRHCDCTRCCAHYSRPIERPTPPRSDSNPPTKSCPRSPTVSFINLTPHPVVINLDNGDSVTFPAAEQPAKVSEIVIDLPPRDGIPMTRIRYGAITGIPEDRGPTYIVARPVAEAARRQDHSAKMVVPYPLLRDDQGRVTGAGGFATL